uniref:Phosphodiesterase n=1 Tax=Pseudonaja textilis TaxID=8673 RepID=A0A670Y2L8_PSETE
KDVIKLGLTCLENTIYVHMLGKHNRQTRSLLWCPLLLQRSSYPELLYIYKNLDFCRSLLDTEDELSSIRWDSVPMDVKEWLTGTFARKKEAYRLQPDEITSFRSISYALENGVVVERQFRTATTSMGMAYKLEVIQAMKTIDKWDFNVFTLDEAAEGHCLKFMICEIFAKYDLLTRFQIPITILISFAKALEAGYSKHKNPYHNSLHAADVTQTVHAIMIHTGMLQWFTDLEILAIFFSSIIHDYEHTGTTNHFHIETRSKAALLYNDRSVLENHHLSAAFRLLQDKDTNILGNLTKDEWRELRRMVINVVLSTDMSHHFQQMKIIKHISQCLQEQEGGMESADISHPAKPWELHHQWSEALLEEFFEQGDKEAEMGLPISSLCDRKTTNIAESQIGEAHLKGGSADFSLISHIGSNSFKCSKTTIRTKNDSLFLR